MLADTLVSGPEVSLIACGQTAFVIVSLSLHCKLHYTDHSAHAYSRDRNPRIKSDVGGG